METRIIEAGLIPAAVVRLALRGVAAGLICGCLSVPQGSAQTKVDLPRQTKNVDFSQATFTKPVKAGTVPPATCAVGELFFDNDALAGQNLYGCTAANTWTLLGAAAGTGGAGDLRVTLASGTYTVAAGTIRFGEITNVFNAATLAAAPAGGDSGTIRFYVDFNAGNPRIACVYPGTFTGTYTPVGLTCSTGTTFPSNAMPLATADAASGVLQAPVDLRASQQSGPIPVAGTGLTGAANGRSVTLSVDASRVTQKFLGAGAPVTVSGSTRGDLYFNTSTAPVDVYECQNAATCAIGADWSKINPRATHTVERMIGLCDSGSVLTANPVWAVDSGTPGAATCGSGFPISFATAYRALSNTADSGLRTVMALPLDWDNAQAVDARIHWAGDATANLNVTFGIATSCLTAGSVFTAAPSYNTEQTVSGAEGTVQFTAQAATVTGLTMTGCAPGDLLRLKFTRRVSDTSTSQVYFLGATVTYRIRGN